MMDDVVSNMAALLAGSGKVVIGVSGGADSMALLHLIVRNREKFNNEFKVLHVDHRLNRDSASWARMVAEYCDSHDMPCEIASVDVSEWGNNLEQAARKARYDAFSKQDCDAIVLAHHANDQLETFFLKLFRGSGVKGLKCMSESSQCWFDPNKRIVRPLLGLTRADIESYVGEHGIPHVTDPSNTDVSFDRNWIRHQLMPLIEERNGIADMNILRSIGIQNETYGLLGELADMDLDRCVLPDGSMDWTVIRTMTLPRLKNMIMRICAKNNLIDVSTHHIEQFAKGLISADVESRNEMRLKQIMIRKIGKKVVVV